MYPVLSLLAATHPEMQGLLIWGENSVIGVDFFFFCTDFDFIKFCIRI